MLKCFEYIQSDIYRYYGKYDIFTALKALLRPNIRYQIIFRVCQSENMVLKIMGRVLMFFNNTKRSIQIPIETKVGYGLYIGHGGPVVVNGTTVIGNNCNLSQFVTIGANEGNAAVIGDNCYIGPSVCIVENICIGNNATIGAGSVVTKDIPANATAAGNYAVVLNFNNPARFIHNRYESCR